MCSHRCNRNTRRLLPILTWFTQTVSQPQISRSRSCLTAGCWLYSVIKTFANILLKFTTRTFNSCSENAFAIAPDPRDTLASRPTGYTALTNFRGFAHVIPILQFYSIALWVKFKKKTLRFYQNYLWRNWLILLTKITSFPFWEANSEKWCKQNQCVQLSNFNYEFY